jgi:XTP/dITP diphosphohydrolase
MIELVFASNNKHKVQEVQAILGSDFRVLSLSDIGYNEDIEETATDLEGNARIKARAIFEKTGKSCFADDTGLEVDTLNGEPGIYSARYAGEAHNDVANKAKLLSKLQGSNNRKAQFRTAICLILEEHEFMFEGIVRGNIAETESGDAGFGYDPIFIPETYKISFAQMSESEKNKISHRGLAVKKLAEFLFSKLNIRK